MLIPIRVSYCATKSNSPGASQSIGFNAAASIFIKSSPGPGFGIGRLLTVNAAKASGIINAFWDMVQLESRKL